MKPVGDPAGNHAGKSHSGKNRARVNWNTANVKAKIARARGTVLFAALLPVLAAMLIFAMHLFYSVSMPEYRDSVGDELPAEKITGLYLLRESAAREDNLIIYGSSELRTTEISTHPSNFFAGKSFGFQVNLIGRGSCQALIHAISIAASGDSLSGKKVVLITSPQSYVPEGIAPDMFMANFSRQQYLELLSAPDIPDEVKSYISKRALELMEEYAAQEGSVAIDPAVRWKAEHTSRPNPGTFVRNAILSPYYALERVLLSLRDKASARATLECAVPEVTAAPLETVDWAYEESQAVSQAESMTGNNEFGILDGYYTTYIGSRLARLKDRDRDLDYSVSAEYDDLRILFEICERKGIEPLFVHVPLHGRWSDYTGFSAERRHKYYSKVLEIAREYGVETLDLTGYEYEDYFLCDVMHLGWKGWLEVDRALIEYYRGD